MLLFRLFAEWNINAFSKPDRKIFTIRGGQFFRTTILVTLLQFLCFSSHETVRTHILVSPPPPPDTLLICLPGHDYSVARVIYQAIYHSAVTGHLYVIITVYWRNLILVRNKAVLINNYWYLLFMFCHGLADKLEALRGTVKLVEIFPVRLSVTIKGNHWLVWLILRINCVIYTNFLLYFKEKVSLDIGFHVRFFKMKLVLYK